MPGEPLTTEQILDLLTRAPKRLAALTDGLDAAGSRSRPDPDAWSATEVLAHLRACADVWGDCIRAILAEDTPTIRAVNPRTWITATDYLEQGFEPSLRQFARQRGDLLSVLEPLPPKGWTRAATVTGAGTPLVRTVLSYADRLARHERQHVDQIESIVSSVWSAPG